MNTTELPFGSWQPDKAAYKHPGLVDALNVYPSPGGYAPFEAPQATGDSVPAAVYGAQFFVQNDGTSIICAGTTDSLLHLDGGTIVETSGYNALAADTAWQFERFNDLIVAVSKENDPQYLTDVDTDSTFSALPGNPPRATVIGRVSDWLVLGQLIDIDGLGNPDTPNRVRWGAFNNPTSDWVTDRGNQSDFRDLDAKYGKVTGIVGGRWGLVFQERAIWRMVYVGAPKVFDFELVADDRGCVAPDSIVTIGYNTYFLDRGGFFVTNGSDVQPIGDDILNEWFENEAEIGRITATHGAINWPKRSIVWAYKKPGSPTFTGQVIYSFVTGEWSRADVELDYLVQDKQDALTLSDLGTLFPAGLGSMSAFSLGAVEWRGRNRILAGFQDASQSSSGLTDESGNPLQDESGNQLQRPASAANFVVFSGANKQAEFVTGDQVLSPGRRTLIDGVMPIVELESGTVSVSTRSRGMQGMTISATVPSVPEVDGFCSQRVDDWFHSFRTIISQGAVWDKASGLWIRAKRGGYR